VLALHGSYTDLSKNNYYLEGDLSCNGFYTGSVVNICLNGHTLNLGSAIRIYPNSTLNIYDCQGTGKIQANTTCIQDINNGNAKLIVHQGTIVSNSGIPVKLTGDDSVIVKGGHISSLIDGSCAIESSGANNLISVENGSIEGMAAAVSLSDGTVTLSGAPDGTFKGNYIVQGNSLREGLITVDGNPTLESQTADLLLSSSKLLAVGAEIDPSAKFSVISEAVTEPVILSSPHETDISSYFVSADPSKAIMYGEENVLELVRSLPASPVSAEINAGESAEFKVEYSAGGNPSYQWYVRNLDNGELMNVKDSNSAVFSTPTELESGSYELYCVVTDETSTYVGDRLSLSVKKDVIENISVTAVSELNYTGEPVSVELNASASTTFGRNVSFAYSLDGLNYTDTVPLLGPDAGIYTIYYVVSADGCEDVNGQLSVEIIPGEQPQLPEQSPELKLSPRLIAIIASSVVFLVLCVVFVIQLIRKKNED